MFMQRFITHAAVLFVAALCVDGDHLTKATPALADTPDADERAEPFWVTDPSIVTCVTAPDDPETATVLKATYPQLRSAQPAMQVINRMIREFVQETQKHFDDVFGKPDPDDDWPGIPFEQLLNFCVMYYSEDLVSVFGTGYEYTHGAHGNYTHYAENFWIVNGEITLVRLSDLFMDGSNWQELLCHHASADLQRQKEPDFIPCSLTIEELDVFWLAEEGITFVFAPYEVGCFAEGSYAVHVPWSVLQPVIRGDGPVGKFAGLPRHE
jgi:hypothetical protein